ncbi:MAG: hypothetical protein IKZ82_09300 [Clostridia bacterium]|nr:hypothetical protein [Clostridia bacterium]
MRGFSYLSIPTAALALMLLSPIGLRFKLEQRGFSARLTLRFWLLFGLIRPPLRFLLEFDAEKAKHDPLDAKNAFSFFRLTRSGELKQVKRKKPKKPKVEKLPAAPILGAISLKRLVIRGHIALEDAADCVLLAGMLNALTLPLLTLAARIIPIRAEKAELKAEFLPKFTEKAFSLAIEGIVKTHPAKLIAGLLSAFAEKSARKRCERGRNKPQAKPNEKGETSCTPLKT